jgi:hypothetical protein
MKEVVKVICWSKGHVTELAETRKKTEKLYRKMECLQAVCPHCRNAGDGNQGIVPIEGPGLFDAGKIFQCDHGHITIISAFGNGFLHTKHGLGLYVNIEAEIQELEELVDTKELFCNHVVDDKKVCRGQLKPIDDKVLTKPSAPGIKTKTRVGDLWDRARLEPVRSGSYDEGGNYHATRTEIGNRARLKRMKRRRVVENGPDTISRNRTTETDYGHRSKGDVNPERLESPE